MTDNETPNTEPATETKVSKSIVKDRAKYKGGNNGDELALALAKVTKGADGKADDTKINEVAKANGIETVKGTNVGMRRMNLGNMLRARYKKGVAVHVGDEVLQAPAKSADAA